MDKIITVEDVAKLYKEKYELLQLKCDMNIVYEGLNKCSKEELLACYEEQKQSLENTKKAVEEEKRNPPPKVDIPEGYDRWTSGTLDGITFIKEDN